MYAFEHINLVVKDMSKSTAFYGTIFPHWRVRAKGSRPWHGKPSNWLHFGDDWQYIAMNDHGEGENRDLAGHKVGLAHFAFRVDNLDAAMARLADAGYKVHSEGAEHPHRKNIYYLDPDGFEIELVEYLSDIPSERNSDA